MKNYKELLKQKFGVSRVFTPVIHVTQGIDPGKEANKASRAGADGVWLICHEADNTQKLINAYRQVRQSSLMWTGVNFLGEADPISVIERELSQDPPGGLWIDSGLTERPAGTFNDTELARELGRFESLFQEALLLRGFSFKHQQETYPSGFGKASTRALRGMHVLTTSGSRTGQPPDLEKIKTIHAAIEGRGPLAIASGVTPKNVKLFLPHVDWLLVSTGLCTEPDVLDPEKLRAFAQAIGREP